MAAALPTQSGNYEELREYVAALEKSSDRARHAFIAVLTVSLLMAVVNYNLQPISWPIGRTKDILMHGWSGPGAKPVPAYQWLRPEFPLHIDEVTADTSGSPASWTSTEVARARHRVREWWMLAFRDAGLPGDPRNPLVLESVRKAYIDQFLQHAIVVDSPIPGLWIDANDLGTIGGAILSLLMVTLVYYLAREHENLYLSLYRVRTLSRTPSHTRGDSVANFLYHALAMRQALSFPPSLARWRRGLWLGRLNLTFFFPFGVYLWVIQSSVMSMERAPVVGWPSTTSAWLFLPQGLFLVVLLALGLRSVILSRSMARRWESAFYRVNPGRRIAPQMSEVAWLSLPSLTDLKARVRHWLHEALRPPSASDEATGRIRITDKIRSQLTDTIRDESRPRRSVIVGAKIGTKRDGAISLAERDAVVSQLMRKSTALAQAGCLRRNCRFVSWEKCRVVQNDRRPGEWSVIVELTYSFRP